MTRNPPFPFIVLFILCTLLGFSHKSSYASYWFEAESKLTTSRFAFFSSPTREIQAENHSEKSRNSHMAFAEEDSSPFMALGNDIHLHILEHLAPETLLIIGQVSRYFRGLVNQPQVWNPRLRALEESCKEYPAICGALRATPHWRPELLQLAAQAETELQSSFFNDQETIENLNYIKLMPDLLTKITQVIAVRLPDYLIVPFALDEVEMKLKKVNEYQRPRYLAKLLKEKPKALEIFQMLSHLPVNQKLTAIQYLLQESTDLNSLDEMISFTPTHNHERVKPYNLYNEEDIISYHGASCYKLKLIKTCVEDSLKERNLIKYEEIY